MVYERELLITEHAGIASKIRDGQAEAAATAVHEHICGFYSRVLGEAVYPNAASRAV